MWRRLHFYQMARNLDLTGKQHSRHQQFWRFLLSPLEAGDTLPRSRDHLFSYSMSKASPPQGPDMWYLTFYENTVPIYQTTISNSLYFKISHYIYSHFCTKLWSKTIHHFKSDLINNMHHMRISGTEPSSVILKRQSGFKRPDIVNNA